MELPETLAGTRAIIFDVGETLVDETRVWTGWAELGVGAPDSAVSLEQSDIYPDALACLEMAKASGRFVGIAGNQPEGLEAQLRSLGFNADFIASSRQWGSVETSRGLLRAGCCLDRHGCKRDSLRWRSTRQRHCPGQSYGHGDSFPHTGAMGPHPEATAGS